MKIRLIAADIDGTLLTPDRRISPRTLRACARAMELGAYLALSSGRMPAALVDFARELRVNAPAVCFNGGAVCDLFTGEILYQTPLEIELARQIARAAERMGMYFHAFVRGAYIAPEYNQRTADYEKLCGVRAEVVNAPLSEVIDEPPMKLLVLEDPDLVARALPVLKAEFDGRATIMRSQRHMIECVGLDTSKANALKFLCARLGVDSANTVAFGDGQNDLDMLSWAGESYVMANAEKSVREASSAFHIAPSNAEDGVAQVLDTLIESGRIGGE